MEREVYRRPEGGGHYEQRPYNPPLSSGKDEYKEVFIEALDRQVEAWRAFVPADSIEALTQRVEIERFLSIRREMAEMEALGVPYELVCDGKTYKVRPLEGICLRD